MKRSHVVIAGSVCAAVALTGVAGRPHECAAQPPAAERAERERVESLAKGDTLSPLFAAVAKAVKPSVVEVRVAETVKAEQPDFEDFFRRFFGEDGTPFGEAQPRRPSSRQQEYIRRGLGSGVVVDAANGYILTNYHVVAGSQHTEVALPDGRTVKAEWARTDPMTDLAVVKIKADGLTATPLGDSGVMDVGDWVLAIGAPQGLAQTVTAGIISAKGRYTGEAATYQSFLQTDAAINFGNSGGPLVNMKGEVIGINTAMVTESGGNEGIGFAIPSNMAKDIMAQLIATGKVVRGYLGVAVQPVDPGLARSLDLPTTKGALISQVTPGAPAVKAGLKPEDFIVSVAGKPVEGLNDLRNRVAALKPGDTVPVEVYRGGKKRTIDVTIGNQPSGLAAAKAEPSTASSAKLGLKVETMSKELASRYGYKSPPEGVAIVEVSPGSPADDVGLQPGMAITEVQGRKVDSARQFEKAVASQAARGVRLRVVDPSGVVRYVFISTGG